MTSGETPFDPMLYLRRATELHGRGQLDAAESFYRRVLEDAPENFDALHLLGVLEAGRKNFTGAVALIARALARDPNNVRALYNYGNALRDANRLEESLASYDRLLALSPQETEALINRGVVLFDLGRFGEALASYDAGIAANPNDPSAHVNRANALMALDRREEAVASFQSALRLRPQSPDVWMSYGKTLSSLQRQAEALQAFKKAEVLFEQAGGSAALHLAKTQFLTGEMLMAAGEFDKATRHFEAAARLNPEDATTHYFLSALTKTNQPDLPPAQYVADLFDEYAQNFDKHLVEGLGYRAPELVCKAAFGVLGAASDLRIVDLGCGTGLCGPFLKSAASHLVGVDLSAKMLRKARERGQYDELIQGDLIASLAGRDDEFDLAIAADVFVYFGNLEPVFRGVGDLLKPGGVLAFTVEEHEGAGFVLEATARYRHAKSYLASLAAAHGFAILRSEQIVPRYNKSEPVPGLLTILRKN